mmetsp:Transcript_18668/g.40415  ORF Transcript_18668/g.40415 Transcript_18668/m.40415 type:complete len:149 (-) Transcript_18668:2485-2931(-)
MPSLQEIHKLIPAALVLAVMQLKRERDTLKGRIFTKNLTIHPINYMCLMRIMVLIRGHTHTSTRPWGSKLNQDTKPFQNLIVQEAGVCEKEETLHILDDCVVVNEHHRLLCFSTIRDSIFLFDLLNYSLLWGIYDTMWFRGIWMGFLK